MNNTYKNIAIAVTFLIIGATLGYMYPKVGKKQNTPAYENQSDISKSKLSVSNISTNGFYVNPKDVQQTIEDLNSLEPFSSDIVIYNSHPSELYSSGITITEVGAKINENIVKDGLKSHFIKNASLNYVGSYNRSREIITSKVKNYSNTVLLDIHRYTSGSVQSDTKMIKLVLAHANPHYDANKKFADQLYQEIKKCNNIKADLIINNQDNVTYNQDLSNKSVLIEVGNDKSSDIDISDCINAITTAIKNVQITSID